MKDKEENKNIDKPEGSGRTPGKREIKPGESATIPVIEERLKVDKEVVETGRVHISKKVHEEEEIVDLAGSREELDIERVAINEFVETPPPAMRHEGDKMIIPVLREVAVVEKRLMLVEELHVTKRKVQTEDRQSVKLRKEEVNVDKKKIDKQDRA